MTSIRDNFDPSKGDPPAYQAAPQSTISASSSSGSGFRTTFACVALSMTDRIRFINIPQDDVRQVQKAIAASWPSGIQDARRYGPSYEIKLSGNPWRHSTYATSDMINARVLLCGLLRGLFDRGWILKGSTDISQKLRDKDSLLFRQQLPPPAPRDWLGIHFYGGDKLVLTQAPGEVCQGVVRALGTRVQRNESLRAGSSEIKFHGYPFRASGEETVHARMLLIVLLEALEEEGYSLYASVDLDPNEHSCDSWVCCREKGWTRGAPVYHS